MKSRSPAALKRLFLLLVVLIVAALAALVWVSMPLLEERGIRLPFLPTGQVLPAMTTSEVVAAAPSTTAEPTDSPVPSTPTPQGTPTRTAVPLSLVDGTAAADALRSEGVMVIAMRDGYYTHLFAYHPLYLPLTRLTVTPWDDITPALSPDGTRLAYASRQNGYWDLYILDLETGRQTRLTDTAEYEAAPTWSPDGLWIAYEGYSGSNLDVFILPVNDPQAAPIRLTDDPGADRSPAWSPQGREIVFVSTRTGDEEIWLARLDDVDERFTNISRSPSTRERHPVWSRDGQQLAWTTESSTGHQLITWKPGQPAGEVRRSGEGRLPVWSPDGNSLFSEVGGPNQTALAAYDLESGWIRLPFTPLPGSVFGMTWVPGPLPEWLAASVENPGPTTEAVLWKPELTRSVAPGGRKAMVELEDVTAPQPMLQDEVDEAFTALRQLVAAETGWDALSSLENAYVALTTPPTPSIYEDWLYTGRAFAVNPLLLSAGWMSIVREDYEGQTYWRVFLKTRYQDGSMGMPLSEMAWDLNARYEGDAKAYEQGGALGNVPSGYWIDLTEMAARFGWERKPSQINWRTFYPSIHYNVFVMTGGLDWYQAMAEIYPPEALATSTPLPTYTPVPTDTPENTPRPVTRTPTTTPTQAPTRRPTWTPLPNP